MKRLLTLLGAFILLLSLSISTVGAVPATHPSTTNTTSDSVQATKWYPGHYFKVGRGELNSFLNEQGKFKAILNNSEVTGVLVSPNWRSIEPRKGQYNFSIIDRSLQKADAHEKKVILRIMDRSFHDSCGGSNSPVPGWVPSGKLGGKGCIAALWEDRVANDYITLMQRVAQRYDNDPRLAAVLQLESAMSIGSLPNHQQKKKEALSNYRRITQAMAQAFERTIFGSYLNYPKEFVVDVSNMLATDLLGTQVGLGGPDIVPSRRDNTIVQRMQALRDKLVLFGGMDGSFQGSDSPQKLCRFQQDIGSHFVIWATWRKDGGSGIVDDTLSFLNKQGCLLNTNQPATMRN